MPDQAPPIDPSAFSRYQFPPEIIMLAVRWYLRYGLSYRDVEELLAERGIKVDHVTIYRGSVALMHHLNHRQDSNDARTPETSPHRAFTGYRFPPEIIMLAVRWYLRYGLSYRDVEELLAERGIDVDHVTIYRWVQRFTPLLINAARPCRRAVGNRWFVDETYVKVAGTWRYVYRAVDQHGQVIDVFVSKRRNIPAASSFFKTAILAHDESVEVVTDLAQALETVIEEQIPRAFHNTEQYANNRVECDHGRLKARLRPMRGLKTDRTASVVIRGHAFIQNLRRGHYELGVEAPHQHLRIAQAFDLLVDLI